MESGVFVARGESVENEELVEGADCMGDFRACLKPSATPTKASQRFVVPELFVDLEVPPNMGTLGGSSWCLSVLAVLLYMQNHASLAKISSTSSRLAWHFKTLTGL